ncbi:uncharacterized protein ARMOST_03310 [Armillaria ostoyae]|uniref:NADH:flavin oxidoreductase/NADH oxidase N-terminal domain-containing protein n=1 Tax=Armillaria ostoyae TaxID=47428 RepID=A0A284QU69_ARMOS|nr:uncharacterized protein ARMOST_03310 [Armillaria ostoyae]
MSDPQLDMLFQPLQLGSTITLENRVQRATGGVGLIISEGILISQQGTEWQNAPGIWSKEQTMGRKKVADPGPVYVEGSIIYAQLWHLGRVSHPDAPEQIASGLGADRVGIKLNPTGGYNDIRMPFEETLQFNYFISEVDKLRIAYVTLVRYAEFLDPIIDGSHLAIQQDVISAYVSLLKNTLVFENAAFTGEEAAWYVSEGKLAGVFFGVPWIAHLYFAKWLQYGKPLGET